MLLTKLFKHGVEKRRNNNLSQRERKLFMREKRKTLETTINWVNCEEAGEESTRPPESGP